MAWIYLAASEDSVWPYPNGLNPSPIVKATDTAMLCFCKGCESCSFGVLPSGTIFVLYDRPCCPDMAVSISSMGGSHARTSALQALEQAWRGSGRDWFERSIDLSVSFDRASSLWRMSLLSGLGEQALSSAKWPASGMTLDGMLFQRKRSELRTLDADGSCLLPTPSASEYGSNQGGSLGRNGQKIRPSLSTMAKKNLWPTPVATEGSKGGPGRKHGDGTPTLSRAVHLSSTQTGSLNPTWVEWLMAYPLEWTALEDWATQWYRPKRVKRSKDSQVSRE